MPCESSANQQAIDQTKFWDENGLHWEPHRIGWAIAGGCTVIVRSLLFALPCCPTDIAVDVYYFFGCYLEALSVRWDFLQEVAVRNLIVSYDEGTIQIRGSSGRCECP